MRSPSKTVLVLAAAAVFAATLAATPAAAKKAAKKPACWKVLINDWYDGRIDGKYELSCYREALKHLNTDVKGYTSAYDDINRAYQLRRAELLGGPKGSDDGGSGGGDRAGTPPGKGGGNDHRSEGFMRDTSPSVAPDGRDDPQGAAGDLIEKLGPADATSIPIPLIVLGGVALLLMAAGAVSLIARRAQGRRVTVPVQPTPPARNP